MMMVPKRKPRYSSGRSLGMLVLFLFFMASLAVIYYQKHHGRKGVFSADVVERTLANYYREVSCHAKGMNLPEHYLLSLIVLESSGRKLIPPRFEPHVFERLKEVREKKRSSYEHVTPEHLRNASDGALRNLASSWGPFQLMGYKCLLLGIYVKDIRGKDAVYWGAKWIDMTYGNELRKGDFKNAFHIHNTGRKYPAFGKPLTHDPKYVENGLDYMERFRQKLSIIR